MSTHVREFHAPDDTPVEPLANGPSAAAPPLLRQRTAAQLDPAGVLLGDGPTGITPPAGAAGPPTSLEELYQHIYSMSVMQRLLFSQVDRANRDIKMLKARLLDAAS